MHIRGFRILLKQILRSEKYIASIYGRLDQCVKGTGAQNIGQSHRVKISAESVHLGEALCKVWWLEDLHFRRSGTLT